MSVPVNQRSHGKLEAYAKAYELATYTLKITKNKKIFTEEYQECLTDYIISAALDIYMCTGTANGKQVRTEKDKLNYEERIATQRKALDRCGDLLKLIMLAKPIFHLSSKRVKYWTGLTKETRTLIKAWSDADIKRFSPLFEDRDVG